VKTIKPTPRVLHLIGALLFGAVALAHLSVVLRYAVDVPFLDEWQYFEPNGLSEELDWGWVLHQHIDHRIVPTHLLAWLLYRINGLDWITHVAVNFGIYLIIPLLFLWIARLQLGKQAWAIWPFLWLLLTPHNFASHRWAFQNQWHFVQIFLTLGAILLFHPRPSAAKDGLGAASLAGAIASFSGGVLPAMWIALTHGIHRIGQLSRVGSVRRDALRALAVVSLVVGAAALWYLAFEPKPKSLPRFWPTERPFWEYYLNGLGLVFGHGKRLIRGGVGLLALAAAYAFLWLAPLAWQAWRQGFRSEDRTLPLRAVLVAGALGGFMVVAHGRAFIAISPRYYEMVLPLLPLMALGWAGAVSARKRGPVLVALWLLVASLDARNWTETKYQAHRDAMLEAQSCIRRYYAGRGPGRCPTTNPSRDIAPLLERATQLQVSFTRPAANVVPPARAD
jgi:hypothetical protein